MKASQWLLSETDMIRSTAFAALFLLATTSGARSRNPEWQTGKLVKQEAVTPTYPMGEKVNCSWPETIYTVDASLYTYQFLGSPFEFYSYAMPLAVAFSVYADGDVIVRDSRTKHSARLRFFRKFAGSGYIPAAIHSEKLKRRNWMPAEVSAARVIVVDFTRALSPSIVMPTSSPLPCAYAFTLWQYTIDVQGKPSVFTWRGRPLDVTVHGVSEFALGKNGSAYLIDDNGKERKLRAPRTAKNP